MIFHVIVFLVTLEACIGGYQISHIPISKEANNPYNLANIPIINFPKFLISLEVTKILNQVSHIPGKYPISLEVKWQISCIPKTPIQASLYPWKNEKFNQNIIH